MKNKMSDVPSESVPPFEPKEPKVETKPVTIEGSAGDIMSKLLFHTFELQSIKTSKAIKVNTTAPKEHERVVEVAKAPKTMAKLAQRFTANQRAYREFDKGQAEKRKAAEQRVRMQDQGIYAHLADKHPDTLEEDHAYTDPMTGEVIPYRVRVDVSTKTDRIPKSTVRELFTKAFQETMKEIYPKVELDRPFDKTTHIQLMKSDKFVERLHDVFATLYQQVQDEHKSFSTSFSIVQIGKAE